MRFRECREINVFVPKKFIHDHYNQQMERLFEQPNITF